jgi:hypothetical protein
LACDSELRRITEADFGNLLMPLRQKRALQDSADGSAHQRKLRAGSLIQINAQ